MTVGGGCGECLFGMQWGATHTRSHTAMVFMLCFTCQMLHVYRPVIAVCWLALDDGGGTEGARHQPHRLTVDVYGEGGRAVGMVTV